VSTSDKAEHGAEELKGKAKGGLEKNNTDMIRKE